MDDNARDKSRVRKILDFCNRIQNTLKNCNNDYDKFILEIDLYQSACMSLFQIGELSSKLSESLAKDAAEFIPKQQIRGLRNRIAHGYGGIEKPVIWQTITEDIPKLREFCTKYLDSNS